MAWHLTFSKELKAQRSQQRNKVASMQQVVAFWSSATCRCMYCCLKKFMSDIKLQVIATLAVHDNPFCSS